MPDSPLYTHLALAVCDDTELLAVVARIQNVPPMNLLFGAVKLRLTPDDALAAWYPHLVGAAARAPDADAVVAFRDYVLSHADDIVAIGASRLTQTNEVGRCAAILPWLTVAAARWDQPVHAVDVGASAGLNLCLDRYSYSYGEHRVGDGRLVLECENRGGFPLPRSVPTFATRTGLDLNPVDATDPSQTSWLEALVWPEHTTRLTRLRAALAIRRETPVTMVAGDATRTLLEVEATLPPGPMLIWHTIALYQFSDEQRGALDAAVAAIAARRAVARVAFESVPGGAFPEIRVGLNFDRSRAVAIGNAHGHWIDSVTVGARGTTSGELPS